VGENIYELCGVTKIYDNGTKANDNISLCVAKGEIFGVFGPNGAGKTTMIKQMVGLLRPTAGTITLYGRSLQACPSMAPHYVAYLGQTVAAFGSFTFAEVIVHAGIHRGLSKAQALADAKSLISRFGLQSKASRLRVHLSGGESKLSILLSVLIGEKPILILDEPTNDLDPEHRRQVWEFMLELCQNKGTTIVLVTHNVDEADSVVDQVAVIDRGALCALGTAGQLKSALGDVVKIIISLKPGHTMGVMPFPGTHLHGQRWCFTVPSGATLSALGQLQEMLGDSAIDDFKVARPTLADVYTQLTRREWDEDSGQHA